MVQTKNNAKRRASSLIWRTKNQAKDRGIVQLKDSILLLSPFVQFGIYNSCSTLTNTFGGQLIKKEKLRAICQGGRR